MDEFNTTVTLAMTHRPSSSVYDITITNLFGFDFQDKSRFTMENHCRISQDDYFDVINLGTLSYIWNITPESPLPLPFLPEEERKESFVENRESITVTAEYLPGRDTSHPLTIMAGHTTSFTYPGHGYIRGGFQTGVDLESFLINGGQAITTRLSFQASIEVFLEW